MPYSMCLTAMLSRFFVDSVNQDVHKVAEQDLQEMVVGFRDRFDESAGTHRSRRRLKSGHPELRRCTFLWPCGIISGELA